MLNESAKEEWTLSIAVHTSKQPIMCQCCRRHKLKKILYHWLTPESMTTDTRDTRPQTASLSWRLQDQNVPGRLTPHLFSCHEPCSGKLPQERARSCPQITVPGQFLLDMTCSPLHNDPQNSLPPGPGPDNSVPEHLFACCYFLSGP